MRTINTARAFSSTGGRAQEAVARSPPGGDPLDGIGSVMSICLGRAFIGTRWWAVAFGLSFPAMASAANHVVTAQSNLTFSPGNLTIAAGDTVTFRNGGGFHNVVSDPGSVTTFRCANGCDGASGNGNLSSAAWSATVTFPTAGTIGYYCEAHGAPNGAGMSGTITVTGSAPALSISNANVLEGNSGTRVATFTISLSRNSASAVTFNIATANGTAAAGSDYIASSLAGRSIPAGMTSQAFNVTINGDTVPEQTETFNAIVSNVAGATLADGTGLGTIVNDDMPRRSDFNGDGRSDLMWRNTVSGANVIWRSANSATQQGVTGVTNQAWIVAGVGDFNGDGKADVLWRNGSSGANVIWRSASAATQQGVTAVSNAAWTVAGIGDFNNDGKADILWRNGSTGANVIWRSALSTTPQGVSSLATAWRVAGVGDFNDDGRADILWRNTSTGANALWFSGNSATAQNLTAIANQQTRVAGVDDFNGDGKADILWRNGSNGNNVIWRSGNPTTPQGVAPIAAAWIPAATGDYNNDGKADIAWRNTSTGANALWYSANSATAQSLTAVNLQWKIVP